MFTTKKGENHFSIIFSEKFWLLLNPSNSSRIPTQVTFKPGEISKKLELLKQILELLAFWGHFSLFSFSVSYFKGEQQENSGIKCINFRHFHWIRTFIGKISGILGLSQNNVEYDKFNCWQTVNNSKVDKLSSISEAIPRIAETSQFEKSEKKLKIYVELMY